MTSHPSCIYSEEDMHRLQHAARVAAAPHHGIDFLLLLHFSEMMLTHEYISV
jgi:hypothetical protein